MMDAEVLGGVGLVLVALVCPLMMLTMMGMAVPFGRRLGGHHGHAMRHGRTEAKPDDDVSP